MGKYDDYIEELIASSTAGLPTTDTENVIISLLRKDDLPGAIGLAKKMDISPSFLSVFAKIMLDGYKDGVATDKDFIIIKNANITPEEADIILREYTGPDGRYHQFSRNVPGEVLENASRGVMISFFEFSLEDGTVGGIEYSRKYWTYLKEKI